MIREYYRLTKPGIVRGNLITAVAGFLFASAGNINLALLVSLSIGISLIIASACVFNNYIDRGVDARMRRTKTRALVQKTISVPKALVFGVLLGILGFASMAFYINTATFVLGVIAYVNYIFIYGLAKRRSIHGTLVGTVSGALPLTAGYTTVTGRIDELVIVLFFIMVFWQMPHFYAIAVFRLKDYKAAGIPVLPAMKGLRTTKNWMVIYILLFAVAILYLYFAGDMSYTYLIGAIIMSFIWIRYGLEGLRVKNDTLWAKGMFGLSLKILAAFSLLISFDNFLP